MPITLLVGRESELAQLDALLEPRAPALVLISGPAGIGKTTLVQAFQDRALTAGWGLAGGAQQPNLAASPSTTPESFAFELRLTLGHSEEESSEPRSLAAVLAEEAPLVVSFELHRPTDAFSTWLDGELMAELRARQAPVIVVCTSPFERDERQVNARADLVLHLGPLDPASVRSALERLPELEPPLQDPELDVYVEAATSPAVLAGLLRVLPHAAASQNT